MQRRLTVFLVALQCVVACGYAVEAQRPEYSNAPSANTAVVAPAVAKTPVNRASAAAGRAGTVVKPAEDLSLRLTPRFVSAPGYVRSLIRVAPHADNRLLRITIDSDSYYRSSDIELDGDAAAESHFIDWKSLPAGKYQFTVTVMGSTGPRAQRHLDFRVLGLGDDVDD
jgi:hypothetical protein